MVLSVEAKQNSAKNWEVCTDNGRERTGLDVIEWIQQGISLGAGEILITSIDKEGTRKGFDCDLIRAVSTISHVPIIAVVEWESLKIWLMQLKRVVQMQLLWLILHYGINSKIRILLKIQKLT